ncbi:MupG family TIM beta-alpha barrel fold protein [Spiroplasma alleghenense]|uniref:Outer surface protein n=1 Tax=Spiroplasma alleghenense TaxID=216931 RepID=A0A345Z4K2_9MOLU|nr:MupG family TIM beta-alpha barrel fold protein [Spiroplasma alleghenense]AXK51531.1 hypothetical protein SALLE_v1c08610 [Spiroplasma alleghenense]
MTRKLGIAIYPDKMSQADIKSYLQLAWKNNFSRAYFTFLPINLLENNQEILLPKILDAINVAKIIGFNTTADINQRVIDDLKIEIKDLKWFKDKQIDIIRFDLPMNSQTIANLSYNPNDIKIELQMSNDNYALQDILSYDPKKENIVGCQNFYPQNYSALNLQYFNKTSIPFLEAGLKTTSYLSSNNPLAFCSWPNHSGTPTLEICRNLSITSQAKLMWATKQVDDLIIANCPATKEEIENLGKLDRFIISLKIKLANKINSIEKIIIQDRQHQNRGDVNDYFIRSTATRVEFKNESNPKITIEKKFFEIGDVLIGNDDAGLYKNELQIVKTKTPNTGEKNLVGKIDSDDHELLKILDSWQRFNLRT